MVDASRLPSLVSIGAFEAAARHGSFAAAARELGTSAASVSYHVRQLEQQLDLRLFRRFAHRVALTGAGEALAADAIAAFEGLRASFLRAAADDDARLALTALPTFGTSWLIPRLGAFRDLHPATEVDLELSADAQDLSEGRFDAAIRNGHGGWPGLSASYLFPSIFMPLCAPSQLAAGLDAPLLGRRDWWDLWFRALGRETPQRFGIHLADEHLDAAAAIAGHGVTIGSPILFRCEIEAGRLVPAHDLVVGDGRSFWLVYPKARRDNAKLRRFHTWLEDQAAEERVASRPRIDRAVMPG